MSWILLLAAVILLALTWIGQRWPWLSFLLAAVNFACAAVVAWWLFGRGTPAHGTYDGLVRILAFAAGVIVAGLGGWFVLVGAIGRRTRKLAREGEAGTR
jgi:hypothetical protein